MAVSVCFKNKTELTFYRSPTVMTGFESPMPVTGRQGGNCQLLLGPHLGLLLYTVLVQCDASRELTQQWSQVMFLHSLTLSTLPLRSGLCDGMNGWGAASLPGADELQGAGLAGPLHWDPASLTELHLFLLWSLFLLL